MAEPAIPPAYRTVSGSKLIDSLAESLTAIKREDELTDAELGKFLHKGVDAGKAYRTGFAEMPVTAFLRGCERWDGRFANATLALIGMKLVPLDAAVGSDRAGFTALCQLLTGLSAALENDNLVDDQELAHLAPALEAAGKHIDRLRARLRPRAVG